ncbi:MAG: RecQ family ATP-dependent DNA helicase, partial [Bacteroidota bacterium]
MNEFQKILTKYWGHPHFRPLQETVIQSVVEKKDTLALMATGGGKSITFQIPALYMEGLCIVITPLIALMKDQVEKLDQLGIKAVALHAGMQKDEIKIAINTCLYGGYKFLYCSPERLGSELFQARIKEANINLIAVDEAHCISQWGYDFRPSYLQIPVLRDMHPEAPVLALTATATPEVADDIQEKLRFKKHNTIQSSFERKNLTYLVREIEDKDQYLVNHIRKMPGTGIIYVRNRKKTKEIANLLNKNGLSADYYHAGLNVAQREKK